MKRWTFCCVEVNLPVYQAQAVLKSARVVELGEQGWQLVQLVGYHSPPTQVIMQRATETVTHR